MKRILHAIDRLFFTPISTHGFGLMRIGWALTVLIFMSFRFRHTTFLYSNNGLLPFELGEEIVFRSLHRYTLLEFITEPGAVFFLYLTLLLTSLCMLLGIWSRLSTIASVLLVFSFHERNLLPLGGGDTVLRHIGFLLMIAPNIAAYSLDRAELQWHSWRASRTLLPTETMAVWPTHLVFWQLMCIYVTSGWDKLLGSMWWDGTSPAAALHHTHFARWPLWLMDILSIGSPLVCLYTLVWEFSWLLLLIPTFILKRVSLGYLTRHRLKRIILIGGILFHGSIFILMEVGSFSIAMMTFYMGLLVQEDFDAIRKFLNRKWKQKIHILYDDNCKLCRRTAFVLLLTDHLKRLDLVNFHEEEKRKEVDDKLHFDDLDKAMHIKLPDGTVQKGYEAVRTLTAHIPAFWLLYPLLHLPGISHLGHKVYAYIAHNRRKCNDEYCEL